MALYVDMYNICACFSLDIQVILLRPFVWRFTRPLWHHTPGAIVNTTDDFYRELWALSLYLYDTIFASLFENIIGQIVSHMESAVPETHVIGIVLIVLASFLFAS
jgi:hypothetical protein